MQSRFQYQPGNAICYSGYRRGQSPDTRQYPTLPQIREDLQILSQHWQHLRLYDCSEHARRVLEIIVQDKLPFTVMLGAYLGPEASNANCPWGGVHSEEFLAASRHQNIIELQHLLTLANAFEHVVSTVAVGNEATVEWTDHLVPVDQMVKHVRFVRERVRQPVTFCENYVPWQGTLNPLVAEVDFISLHTYPVWEYKGIHEALSYTQQNVNSVASRYPDKPIVITEAGWATHSNGRGINPDNVSQHLQAIYYQELMEWAGEAQLMVYVFEAFDEPWKGSADPLEPEKHWGLFDVDRKPKLVMQEMFSHLMA